MPGSSPNVCTRKVSLLGASASQTVHKTACNAQITVNAILDDYALYMGAKSHTKCCLSLMMSLLRPHKASPSPRLYSAVAPPLKPVSIKP